MATDKPRIAISRCLLNEKVRYDGELLDCSPWLNFLQQHFELFAVCPEVEIGMSVPRPPVQIVVDGPSRYLRGRDDPGLDVSQAMHQFCHNKPAELTDIHGYIFKSRSPSCGVNDTPHFNPKGEQIDTGAGLFTDCILKHFPDLPITDEQGLINSAQQQAFLQQVTQHALATLPPTQL